MKMQKKISLLLAFLTTSAFGGVNLKNGNFYVSYTDIIVPGTGKNLEMTRTYNSKSTEKGWFGFGWGNVYETKLIKSPDGCVVVHEHGAGGKTRFCPKNPVDPKVASEKIIKAMRKKSQTISAATEKNLLKRLSSNAELRHVYARRFNVESKIASGTTLYSNQRGIQQIKVEKNGFKRTSNDGKTEFFNQDGKLTKIKFKNNRVVSFSYKGKRLAAIKDGTKQIFFDWYSSGRVKKMWTADDKVAEFKYDKKGNMIFSKDVAGNEYGYDYDSNHNLTKVVYNPNRKKGTPEDSMIMEYDPKTFFVTKITDRNGDTTKYKYDSNPKNPKNHYWTEVTKKGFNGKEITNRYEYEIKTKPDGQRYTYRIFTKINGITTETIYTECCGLPKKIARGKVVTTFAYNDKGLLTQKESTTGEFVRIKYNKKHNKISEVKNRNGITKFNYDGKGNLVFAENDKGKKVKLVYNSKGRITTMLDRDAKQNKKRVLTFKYNADGKPIEINMQKVGKINVQYDNYGEIKSVKSDQGHKMALQVTQAFQNLLAIVKPAGVNLNM